MVNPVSPLPVFAPITRAAQTPDEAASDTFELTRAAEALQSRGYRFEAEHRGLFRTNWEPATPEETVALLRQGKLEELRVSSPEQQPVRLLDTQDLLELDAFAGRRDASKAPNPLLAASLQLLERKGVTFESSLFEVYNGLLGDAPALEVEVEGRRYALKSPERAQELAFLAGLEGIEVPSETKQLAELVDQGFQVGLGPLAAWLELAEGRAVEIAWKGVGLGTLEPGRVTLSQEQVETRGHVDRVRETVPADSVAAVWSSLAADGSDRPFEERLELNAFLVEQGVHEPREPARLVLETVRKEQPLPEVYPLLEEVAKNEGFAELFPRLYHEPRPPEQRRVVYQALALGAELDPALQLAGAAESAELAGRVLGETSSVASLKELVERDRLQEDAEYLVELSARHGAEGGLALYRKLGAQEELLPISGHLEDAAQVAQVWDAVEGRGRLWAEVLEGLPETEGRVELATRLVAATREEALLRDLLESETPPEEAAAVLEALAGEPDPETAFGFYRLSGNLDQARSAARQLARSSQFGIQARRETVAALTVAGGGTLEEALEDFYLVAAGAADETRLREESRRLAGFLEASESRREARMAFAASRSGSAEGAEQLRRALVLTGNFAGARELVQQAPGGFTLALTDEQREALGNLPPAARGQLAKGLVTAPVSSETVGRLLGLAQSGGRIEFELGQNWSQKEDGLHYLGSDPKKFTSYAVSSPIKLAPGRETVVRWQSEGSFGQYNGAQLEVSSDGENWKFVGALKGSGEASLFEYTGQEVRLRLHKYTHGDNNPRETLKLAQLELDEIRTGPQQILPFRDFTMISQTQTGGEWRSNPFLIRGPGKPQLKVDVRSNLQNTANHGYVQIAPEGTDDWETLIHVQGDTPNRTYVKDLSHYANRSVVLRYTLVLPAPGGYGTRSMTPGAVLVRGVHPDQRGLRHFSLQATDAPDAALAELFEKVLDPARPAKVRENIATALETLVGRTKSLPAALDAWKVLEPIASEPDLDRTAAVFARLMEAQGLDGAAALLESVRTEREPGEPLGGLLGLAEGREPSGYRLIRQRLRVEPEALGGEPSAALSLVGALQGLVGPEQADQIWDEVSMPFRGESLGERLDAFGSLLKATGDAGAARRLWNALVQGLDPGDDLASACRAGAELAVAFQGNLDRAVEVVDFFQERQREGAASGRPLAELCRGLLTAAVLEEGDLETALQAVLATAAQQSGIQVEEEHVVINDVSVRLNDGS